MSKKDNQAAVALHFDGGAVIAANRRGTVSSDTVFYGYCKETEVPIILRMSGTTRAVALAGETGEVLRSIGDNTRDREGAPCIWYGNHLCPSIVASQRAIGPGRVSTRGILARHKIGISEKEAIELAEQAIVEVAVCCHQKEGSLDVWVIRDGKITKNQTQLMTHVAEKYGVSI
ncbi:uncharacterized protein LOC113285427 isoform X2 [Papaver somniferum]|uniref:uncharacterized protein LOC113285427 isoform X2 n=1 Tax=Papaver somniferum TaxID=3469 RepID=UPI000E6FF299|nr:uncharacterized protein LOC113285427 isoform X2 [Papaver somniferum]